MACFCLALSSEAVTAFDGGRLERWIRWVFIVNGVSGIAGVVLGGMGIMAATMVSLVAWGVTFPVGTILVAVLFRRAGRMAA